MAEKNENRTQLIDQLNDEFDANLRDVLEKNKLFKYNDVLTADNIEEEIAKTPAFLDRPPTQEEIDASPALSALQALKYEETDPRECALAHKEDGNHHFKLKKYDNAISAYSEGLKQKFEDTDLRVILFTNRAVANFYLKNYRSSFKDTSEALKINGKHMKAILRAAMCCLEMQLYDDCVHWCDEGLQIDPKEKKLISIRKQSLDKKKVEERDKRKRDIELKKAKRKQMELIDAMFERDVKVEGNTSKEAILDKLKAQSMNQPQEDKIFMDGEKQLHWPVYFLYPEFNQSDFIEDFCESTRFIDHLDIMFDSSNLPDWDTERHYNKDHLKVFYENRASNSCIEIPVSWTLKEVLSEKSYVIRNGAPSFIILSTKSKFFQEFTKTVQIKMMP